MKIAIIGSNSFLAKNLALKISDGNDLYLYGRHEDKKDYFMHKTKYIEFYHPITPLDLSELLIFDYIIYTASVGVQASNRPSNLLLYQVNLFIPIEIATFLSDNKYKGKFMTFGSYFEIGANDSIKQFNEIEVIRSTGRIFDSYCDSKRLLSNFYMNKQFNISWYHLILPSIYGPNENGKRLIPYVIDSIKSNSDPQLSSGEQIRQYLFITDLVDLINQIIMTDVPADVYNVSCCEEFIKIKDLVSLIYKIMGKKQFKHSQILTRDQGMAFLGLNAEKIKKTIPEWNPKIYLKEGIKKYL